MGNEEQITTMQPTMRIVVSMVLLASALASAYHSSAKLRRDGVLNLYPFPRVGRASRNTWQLPLNDLYLDFTMQNENNDHSEPEQTEPVHEERRKRQTLN
ncbi:hypothetical protein HF086_000681 [Spodoptera exigua]|uniref:Uncharacterized protein n=1 Tax=Spodoptera exigua TaxID=7107 RepID=A0A922MXW1_SPOEX|nr:hypothetical protein HF086_000681 [Spodoptera exigua]